MSKQKNPNIGHVECAECKSQSALRKDKNGNLYYDCMGCGRMAPNHRGGQERLLQRAVIWGAGGAPAGVPRWIAENLPYAQAIREGRSDAPSVRKPAPEIGPTENPAPVIEAATDEIPEAPPPPPSGSPKEKPRGSPRSAPRSSPRKTPENPGEPEGDGGFLGYLGFS